MKNWLVILALISSGAFADPQYSQKELTIKLFWDNKPGQLQFVPVLRKLLASQVANGDVKIFIDLPEKNQMCVIHTYIDQYVRTAHLVRPVVEVSGGGGAFGVEDCD